MTTLYNVYSIDMNAFRIKAVGNLLFSGPRSLFGIVEVSGFLGDNKSFGGIYYCLLQNIRCMK